MPRDHFIPKTYLRGFTSQYLGQAKTNQIVVYQAATGKCRPESIDCEVGFEPDLYNGHPVDRKWREKTENRWPGVRDGLKRKTTDDLILTRLLDFVSAQFLRTPSAMDRVARGFSFQSSVMREIPFEGRQSKVLVMKAVGTTQVMDQIQRDLRTLVSVFKQQYAWRVCHSSSPTFITSDLPCVKDIGDGWILMPIALDMVLCGRPIVETEAPSFEHHSVDDDFVMEVNRAMVRGCSSYVYAHEESQVLSQLVRDNSRSNLDPADAGRSFTNSPDSLSNEAIEMFLRKVELERRKKATPPD